MMSKELFDFPPARALADGGGALSTSDVSLPGGLSFRRLTAEETPAFEGMTFPAHKHLLSLQPSPRLLKEKTDYKVQPLAFGAFDEEGKPAALALLVAPPEEGLMVEILSIFVVPAHRRQGVGTALLQALETPVRAQAPGMRTVYSSAKSYAPIVERMLASCSWREPEVRMHFFKIRLEDLGKLTRRLNKPRRGYEISLWSEVPKEDRQKMLEQPWAQMQISPKVSGQDYDRDVSLALRYHGELVGWVIAERVSEDTGRVASTYVRPDLSRSGALIPVLARCAEMGWAIGYRKATFTAVPSHAKLMHFAYRRLAPHCYSVVESRGAERHFSDD